MCFAQTATLTNGGTMISSLGEEDALTTALATALELIEIGEYCGIELKDG